MQIETQTQSSARQCKLRQTSWLSTALAARSLRGFLTSRLSSAARCCRLAAQDIWETALQPKDLRRPKKRAVRA